MGDLMPVVRYAVLMMAMLIAPEVMAQTAPAAITPTPAPSAPTQDAATPTPPGVAPVTATAAEPLPACELHIWPASVVAATTQGAGAGFGLIGALIDASAHADQNKRDTAFITGALDAHAQARVLREMDLPSQLHLPPSQVIVHDDGIDLKADHPGRLSASTAVCYTEFVVRGLRYFKNAVYKGQMRTFLEVRGFDGPKVTFDFRDSKHEDLEVKLPKEGEDTGPATDALLKAFRADVAFFGDKFVKSKKH